MRIFLACLMSLSVSARGAATLSSSAKPASSIVDSMRSDDMRFLPGDFFLRDTSDAIFQNDIGQIIAVIFLVDRVELAVLQIGLHPIRDSLQQPGLALLHADGELEGFEHEFQLELAARIPRGDRPEQQFAGREQVDLAADESL